MPTHHEATRARRRRALLACLECGAPALPECLLCGSEAILRHNGVTACAVCENHTLCPCFAGFLFHNDDEGDAAPVA